MKSMGYKLRFVAHFSFALSYSLPHHSLAALFTVSVCSTGAPISALGSTFCLRRFTVYNTK
jgi:hypothetical protein